MVESLWTSDRPAPRVQTPGTEHDPKFSVHWSQVVLGVLLLCAVVGLVLHAVDAKRDEEGVAAAITQIDGDAASVISVQNRGVELYDAVDRWHEGGQFPPVVTAADKLESLLRSTNEVGSDVQGLVGATFVSAFDRLRAQITSPAPDADAAYEQAEPFERTNVALSRRYESLVVESSRTALGATNENEERGMRLLLLVIVLGAALATVTVRRSRSIYRTAKARLERDRDELARASVLERGEAEILSGIVASDDIAALVVGVLDLAHRLTGGCLRFVAVPGLDVAGLPPVVVRSDVAACSFGAHGDATAEVLATWDVGAGSGLELGALQLCAGKDHAAVDERLDAVARRCADLISLVIGRALAEEQLRFRASHDALTGMPNRSYLLDTISNGLESRSSEEDDQVALVFCDLDRFKLVNDTLGHRSGDELLRAVGRRLCASVTDADTVVARLGGDEFVAVCVGPDAGARAWTQAMDLEAALQSRFVLEGTELFVTASFGVAVSDASTSTAEQLLRNADMAMYSAKRNPMATVAQYDAELERGLAAQLDIDVALRQALAQDGLSVYLQPIVDVDSSNTVGVEALVRWERDGALLAPAAFLDVARANGLMGELGRVVTARALAEVSAVRTELPDLSLWLNVDRLQLLDPEFPVALTAELERSGLPPTNLVLEISEADLLHVDDIGNVLDELRSTGIRLAMDDFGTGYSSIVRLTELPVDLVKLDRALIAGAGTGDQRAEDVLAAAVALVAAAGLDVVAEGVETDTELSAVRQLGCNLVQGYLLRRPGPAGEVLAECVRARPGAVT